MVFLTTVIVLITALIGLATKIVELVTMVCYTRDLNGLEQAIRQSMNAKGILAIAKEMDELIEQLIFVLFKEQRELKQ